MKKVKRFVEQFEPDRPKLSKQVQIRLTDFLYDNLTKYAKSKGVNPSVIVRHLIRTHVPSKGAKV